MITRRELVRTSASLGALSQTALAGCVAGLSDGASNRMSDSIVVFSWYDEWHDVMLEEFQREYDGIETHLTSYSSNQELYAKLKAGGTEGADIVMPSNNMLSTLQDEGMIRPIDTSRLDRWSLQKPIAEKDPWQSFLKYDGDYFGVPFTRGYYTNYARGQLVDDGTIPEDLVDSWDIYFEDHEANLGIKDYGRRNVSIVLWHLRGADADINNDPGNVVSWAEIEDKLVELINNATAIYTSNEDGIRLFANGSVDIINIWNGNLGEIKGHQGGEDVRSYFPREGSNGWFDSYCIPADPPHPDLAHEYIDFTLKPSRQAKAVEVNDVYTVQPGLIEKVEPDLKDLMEELGNVDASKLQPYSPEKELQRRATEVWNSAKSRAG